MTKTKTNLTKNTQKKIIVDVSDSPCYTAWKKARDQKKVTQSK